MLSFFGPVATLELTSVVRRRRYYFLRAIHALLLLIVLIGSYLTVVVAQPTLTPMQSLGLYAQFADVFFFQFGFVQLAAVLLLTPAYVAASLVVEKQRRTLECLFTTDVWDTEIVLGKWLARSLNVVLLVLAGIPVLAFASLLGGIDFSRLGVLCVLALCCLVSTAAITLAVSVYSRHVHQALAVTYLLLVFFLLGPLLHGQLSANGWTLARLLGRSPLTTRIDDSLNALREALATAEPFSIFIKVMEEDNWWRESGTQLAWVFLAHLSVALGCLLWAIFRLRPVHLRELARDGKKQSRIRRPLLVLSLQLFSRQPMIWKEWHFQRQSSGGWGARLVGLALVAALYFPAVQALLQSRRPQGTTPPTWSKLDLHQYVQISSTLLIGLTWIVAATRGAVSMGEERDQDTASALLLTSLSAREILRGKSIGALKPLVLLLAVLLPLWLLAAGQRALSWEAIPWLLGTSLAVGFCFVAIGLHQSLCRQTVLGAVTATAIVLLFVAIGGQSILVVCLLPFLASLPQVYLPELVRLSLPECLLWEAAYREGWGPFANGYAGVFIGTLCLVGYTTVGLFILRHARTRFAGSTQLSDGGHQRSLPWSEIKGLALHQQRSLAANPDLACP